MFIYLCSYIWLQNFVSFASKQLAYDNIIVRATWNTDFYKVERNITLIKYPGRVGITVCNYINKLQTNHQLSSLSFLPHKTAVLPPFGQLPPGKEPLTQMKGVPHTTNRTAQSLKILYVADIFINFIYVGILPISLVSIVSLCIRHETF